MFLSYVKSMLLRNASIIMCDELLNDVDCHFDQVKFRKIEQMMPRLMKMVGSEMVGSERVIR